VKVLITGASGQVGSALLRAAPPGWTVMVAGHDELDITVPAAVGDAVKGLRPALIINAAAYTAVDRAESEPERARRCNVTGPHNLAVAAARNDIRLLHLSTDFVFDGSASTAYEPPAATNPLSVYGQTKRDGEVAVREELGERAVILRTAWVYSSTGANFLKTMLRIMRERGSVRVVSDQIGTPTAAHSLAAAVWRIAELESLGGILHWTDAGVASWYDFAVAIAEEAAHCGQLSAAASVVPISSSEYPTPARRPRFSVLDCSTTRQATGIQPVHWRANLRQVLKELGNA
jgi:dTDP-4-dehydrorhamnose reductase